MRGTRNTMLVRILRMHALMRRRYVTVKEIARELDAHPRTVYRDLAAMQEAHVPIVEQTEDHTRRYRVTG